MIRIGRRKARPQLTPEQALASRPLRNPNVAWKKEEDGTITLPIERREDTRTRLISALFPIPRRKRLSLDDLGSEVWEMCDGELALLEMTRRLARKHKLNLKEAEQSLLKFLNDLAQRGLLGFQLREPEPVAATNRHNPKDTSRRRKPKKRNSA